MYDGRNDRDRDEAEGEESAPIERVRPLVGQDEEGDQAGQPGNGNPVAQQGGARRGTALESVRDPDASKRCTEEQAAEPGIGPVVDARRIECRVEEGGHPRGRQDRATDRENRDTRTSGELDGKRKRERPHEVELLLDRQRPQVQQWRRPAERLEVRLLADDQVPVRAVGERRKRVRTQPRDLVGKPEEGRDEHARKQREHGGQEAARTAQPEAHHVDAGAAIPLGEEQCRDEVARDHEEDFDAKEAAAQPPHPGVVQHHCADGERAQTVETGQAREALTSGEHGSERPPVDVIGDGLAAPGCGYGKSTAFGAGPMRPFSRTSHRDE
jgi:hypothetical protein